MSDPECSFDEALCFLRTHCLSGSVRNGSEVLKMVEATPRIVSSAMYGRGAGENLDLSSSFVILSRVGELCESVASPLREKAARLEAKVAELSNMSATMIETTPEAI